MPKVSVIMGAYNCEKKITTAVESILNQTFADFEIIICNDGSTDNTLEVLNSLKEKDTRIKVISNEQNSGLAVSLNNCLKISEGEYIARMDDDDISHPTRFERQVKFLDEHKEYQIVSTGRNMFDENGVWGTDDSFGERNNCDIFRGNYFAHPTVMMRKDALLSVGGYSTYKGIGREEDTDLWCKMYVAGYKGYVLGEVLFDYFESTTSMKRRKFKYRIAETKIKLKYAKGLKIPFLKRLYAFKPILVGLLPHGVVKNRHKKRFNQNKVEK